MNREIKFRAWNHENHEMEYSDVPPSFSFWKRLSYDSRDLGSLMQFIGIKDKNGIEIYEGDAISTDLQRKHNIVVFRNGAFMFQCFDADEEYFDFMLPSNESGNTYAYGEVVGNIYETPELLEAQDERN